eukprot:g50418.t1
MDGSKSPLFEIDGSGTGTAAAQAEVTECGIVILLTTGMRRSLLVARTLVNSGILSIGMPGLMGLTRGTVGISYNSLGSGSRTLMDLYGWG